jgi:chromosomal replication initiator protein
MNSASDVLARVLALMESEISKTTIATWFDDASAVDLKPDALVLYTPSDFKRSVIESRYMGYLKAALKQIFSSNMEVVILSGNELENYRSSSKEQPLGDKPATGDTFEHTFATFVIGSSNKFAHAAAYAVANNPAKAYNPLFIYGGSGLGKTHLIRAISHFTELARPDYRIVYVKGDDFTNDVISAIGSNATDKLRARYRVADLLLVDDIQFIAGKPSTQEEFFHTFNTLYEANKQIVLTSDRPPKEIYTLEDRLRTR